MVSLGHIALLDNKGTTQIQVETRNTHRRREFLRVTVLRVPLGHIAPHHDLSRIPSRFSLALSHTFVLPSLDISRREREK